jgi:hypothetical protein
MKQPKSVHVKRAYIEVPYELRVFLEEEARTRDLDVDELLSRILRAGIARVCGKRVSGSNAVARGVLKHDTMKSIQSDKNRPRNYEEVSLERRRRASAETRK